MNKIISIFACFLVLYTINPTACRRPRNRPQRMSPEAEPDMHTMSPQFDPNMDTRVNTRSPVLHQIFSEAIKLRNLGAIDKGLQVYLELAIRDLHFDTMDFIPRLLEVGDEVLLKYMPQLNDIPDKIETTLKKLFETNRIDGSLYKLATKLYDLNVIPHNFWIRYEEAIDTNQHLRLTNVHESPKNIQNHQYGMQVHQGCPFADSIETPMEHSCPIARAIMEETNSDNGCPYANRHKPTPPMDEPVERRNLAETLSNSIFPGADSGLEAAQNFPNRSHRLYSKQNQHYPVSDQHSAPSKYETENDSESSDYSSSRSSSYDMPHSHVSSTPFSGNNMDRMRGGSSSFPSKHNSAHSRQHRRGTL